MNATENYHIQNLQQSVERLTVENMLLKSKEIEAKREIQRLREKLDDKSLGHPLPSALSQKLPWYRRRIFHVSMGLAALAIDGVLVALEIAFPGARIWHSILAQVMGHVFVASLAMFGTLAILSGTLDEICSANKKAKKSSWRSRLFRCGQCCS